jgi:putative endonuclease
MNLYHVYILECADHSFYVGVTSNLKLRLDRHEKGYFASCYTYTRRPLKLAFHAAFTNIFAAIRFEKKVKKWRREKKIALINGDFDGLKEMNKKGPSTARTSRSG